MRQENYLLVPTKTSCFRILLFIKAVDILPEKAADSARRWENINADRGLDPMCEFGGRVHHIVETNWKLAGGTPALPGNRQLKPFY